MKLVGAGDVAGSVDVGEARLKEFVGFHGLSGRDAEFLQAVAGEVRCATDGDENGVEGDSRLAALVFSDQRLLAVFDDELLCAVPGQDADAFARKALLDHRRNIFVFAYKQAQRHFDERDLRAKAGEGLRQFATDRSAA